MTDDINNLFASEAFQRFNLCLITYEVETTECLRYKKNPFRYLDRCTRKTTKNSLVNNEAILKEINKGINVVFCENVLLLEESTRLVFCSTKNGKQIY